MCLIPISFLETAKMFQLNIAGKIQVEKDTQHEKFQSGQLKSDKVTNNRK